MQKRATIRTPTVGHIDNYGYHPNVGGWFVFGWAGIWQLDEELNVKLGNSIRHGKFPFIRLRRDDLAPDYQGFVLFIPIIRRQAQKMFWLEIPSLGRISIADHDTARLAITELEDRCAFFYAQLRAQHGHCRNAVADALKALDRLHQVSSILGSAQFDADFYRSQLGPDFVTVDLEGLAAHFLDTGYLRFKPNANFDPQWYLLTNPDIAESAINPLFHYVKWGAAEGRLPAPPAAADRSAPVSLDSGLHPVISTSAILNQNDRSPQSSSAQTTDLPRLGHDLPQVGIAAVARLLSSRFVDKDLFRRRLGGDPLDTTSVELYLRLPPRTRPKISVFFDVAFYLEKYADIAEDPAIDPLLHFLETGCHEQRSPHPLIDLDYIISQSPHLLSTRPRIDELTDIIEFDLQETSPYFVFDEYRSQLGHPPTEGLLGHFLQTGAAEGLRPNRLFDPQWYYRRLVGAHTVWSGLRHFVLQGDRQCCDPSPEFSSSHYLAHNPDLAASGVLPLRHYLTQGKSENRTVEPVAPSAQGRDDTGDKPLDLEGLTQAYEVLKRKILHDKQAAKGAHIPVPPPMISCPDAVATVLSLQVPAVTHPRVSILVPVFNEFNYTVECIASIVASSPTSSYEIILADDASTDPNMALLADLQNIRYLRQDANVGFLENCNRAVQYCQGEYIFLLNNDTQLLTGALDALSSTLASDPSIGAVGPKIIYPDGRLQEAGCTVDISGCTTMIGLFGDAADASYTYDRDVYYCSGAALLIRRSALGDVLFDPLFKPAYCEDSDLCLDLISRGFRVVYCATATVVHHLSVSTNKQSMTRRLQLVGRNQQILSEKWTELLRREHHARILSFYLPQFHPTLENNYYWGTGFTEWTNVTKATPAFEGHYQPHLPADLGFYDLRLVENFAKQGALARRYGLSGFCVYYYNFGEQRALYEGIELLVGDRSIDFPFCVCWANENWTRHWDGGSREIIFEQQYTTQAYRRILEDLVRYAADPRYLTVNGKPIFVIYRPLLIPNLGTFISLCRRTFVKAGFPGVYLLMTESMESATAGCHPIDLGFDASVEFPPHGHAVPVVERAGAIRPGYSGKQYDYGLTVLHDLQRPQPAYKRHPAVFPSWDNTPRQPLLGDTFLRASPEAFQLYLEEKLDRLINFFVGEERILFINAWNEWAEGTHLEPDQRYGHRWLAAVENALFSRGLV